MLQYHWLGLILPCSGLEMINKTISLTFSSWTEKNFKDLANHCEIGLEVHVWFTSLWCLSMEPWMTGWYCHHQVWSSAIQDVINSMCRTKLTHIRWMTSHTHTHTHTHAKLINCLIFFRYLILHCYCYSKRKVILPMYWFYEMACKV